MRSWTKQIRALELFGEKNRLGRGSNLGQAGGNLCLLGPERFFSIIRNTQYTYPLFGRALFFSYISSSSKTFIHHAHDTRASAPCKDRVSATENNYQVCLLANVIFRRNWMFSLLSGEFIPIGISSEINCAENMVVSANTAICPLPTRLTY